MFKISLELKYAAEEKRPSHDLALHQCWLPEGPSSAIVRSVQPMIPKPPGELGRLSRGYGLRKTLCDWDAGLYDTVQVSSEL